MHRPREPRRTARASPLAGWKTAWSRAANMRCVSGPKLWLMAMALAGGSLPCAGEPREAGLAAGPPPAVARSALAREAIGRGHGRWRCKPVAGSQADGVVDPQHHRGADRGDRDLAAHVVRARAERPPSATRAPPGDPAAAQRAVMLLR